MSGSGLALPVVKKDVRVAAADGKSELLAVRRKSRVPIEVSAVHERLHLTIGSDRNHLPLGVGTQNVDERTVPCEVESPITDNRISDIVLNEGNRRTFEFEPIGIEARPEKGSPPYPD